MTFPPRQLGSLHHISYDASVRLPAAAPSAAALRPAPARPAAPPRSEKLSTDGTRASALFLPVCVSDATSAYVTQGGVSTEGEGEARWVKRASFSCSLMVSASYALHSCIPDLWTNDERCCFASLTTFAVENVCKS